MCYVTSTTHQPSSTDEIESLITEVKAAMNAYSPDIKKHELSLLELNYRGKLHVKASFTRNNSR